MNLINKMKVGIVGLGLMGGSYAQGLSDLGFEVGAIDKNQESIDYAIEHGLIKHGQVEVTEDYVKQFDIVIFAIYPHAFIEWIKNYQSYFKSGALITDVTGVKTCVVYDIQAMLREDLEYIPCHPMAGRECSGVQNAKKDIFYPSNYIITPTEKNTEEAIDVARQLGMILGFKRISVLTPEKHDEVIGFLSQLTHCIAIALMTCKDAETMAPYSGNSFRDLTRIAKLNDEMWSELFLVNKEELLNQMDAFEQSFHKLKETIVNDDREAMREMMRESTRQRILFDKK